MDNNEELNEMEAVHCPFDCGRGDQCPHGHSAWHKLHGDGEFITLWTREGVGTVAIHIGVFDPKNAATIHDETATYLGVQDAHELSVALNDAAEDADRSGWMP